MKKTISIILLFVSVSTATFAVSPMETQAASCPEGTEARSRAGTPGFARNYTAQDCYKNGVYVGTAALGGYWESSPTQCVGTITTMSNFFPCLWRGLWTWLGTGIIYIGITFLGICGYLFNIVLDQTVIKFNEWLTGGTMAAIGTAWAFFRDIANIIIIGSFVFIAISIILGLKEYGQKKLIARVLIVAVLINFSFLFTRLIINFSNALSTQFSSTLVSRAAGAQNAPAPLPDVAGEFTSIMGLKSIKDTQQALAQIADKEQSAFIALGYGLLVFALVVAVALVLLYAAILLIARAIAFIFLLITGSIAFATYLVPTISDSNYGWKAWWNALLRNALLAPVMLLFLKATLDVSRALASALPSDGSALTGSLGGLISAPTSAGNAAALLNYLVILGLLYGAIRISSMLSSMAAMRIVGGSIMAPLGVAASVLGFGNQMVNLGRATLLKKERDKLAAKNVGTDPGFIAAKQKRLTELSKQIYSAKAASKRDINPFNTAPVKAAAKSIFGNTGLAAGQTKLTSYGKLVDERGKKIAEKYQDAEVNKKDTTAMAETMLKNQRDQRDLLKMQKEQSQQNRQAAEIQKAAAVEERKAAQEQVKQIKDAHRADEVTEIAQQNREDADTLASDPNSVAARDRIERNRQRAQQIEEERNRKSSSAQMKVDDILQRIRGIDTEISAQSDKFREAQAQERKLDKEITDTVEEQRRLSNEQLAEWIGSKSSWNKDFAAKAAGEYREHGQKKAREAAAAALGFTTETPTPAAQPAASATPATDANPH